ncbi:MAG: hypothetical protein HWN67_10190 [Candidatus Helarchaeota archaeon]|nr:hypothetical protein [Candidatus Helarchaeota archaeon]
MKTLPFWDLSQNDLTINELLLKKDYDRVIPFILNKKGDIESFGSIEDTFWILLALHLMQKLDLVNNEKINKFIFRFRSPKGGFFSKHEDYPDARTTFYAISCLHLLDLDLNEDEKRITFNYLMESRTKEGLFLHCRDPNCNCRQQTAFMYTFFAIGSIVLLNFQEKLESEFFEKITSLSFNIHNFDTFFFFLTVNLLKIDIKMEIKDLLKIIHFFQRKSGGFGRVQDTFWIITWLNSHKFLHRINKGVIIEKFLENQKNSDGGYNEQGESTSNLKVTTQAIIILSILNSLIVKELENEIFNRLSENTHNLLKRFSDQFSIKEGRVAEILGMLNSKYKWLNIKLLKFESVFSKYVQNLKALDQKIGKNVLKSVYEANQKKIDLLEFANSLNVNEEQIIRVIYDLIDSKLIYGNIEPSQLIKDAHILEISYLPEFILVRKDLLPSDEVLVEMESLNLVQEQINEALNNLQKYPIDFKESIEYLLDIDEVEIANFKIDRLFNDYLIIIKSNDEDIADKVSSMKYFKSDITNLYQKWKNISTSTLKALQDTHNDLSTKISSRMKIVTAYNELESFVNFVNENITKFRNKIEVFIAIFYKTCSRNELSLKSQEFLDYLDKMDEDFKEITQYIQKKSKELASITKKTKLFKNVIISDDPQLRKRIVSTAIKKKLQPFENWLENQWSQKRNDSFKKITEFKSKIHKHEELINHIKEMEISINSQLKSINNLENHGKIYSGTVKIINSINKSDKYISNFIRDTNKILEDFDLVVQDIPIIWADKIKQFGKKVQSLREKIGKKIIDKLEIQKKNEFEENIEAQIQNFMIKINDLDKIQSFNWKKINISYRELLNNQLSLIKQTIFQKNEQITGIYRENSEKFSRFGELSLIPLRKWENFYDSIDDGLRKKENDILDILLVRILFQLSTPRTGGRVNLSKLSEIIGLDQNIIRKRLKKLEENFKIEVNFIEKSEVIPLTEENQAQLRFEDFVLQCSQEFKESNEQIIRFFKYISDRKKISENEEEIKSKLEKFSEKIINSEMELQKNFSIQMKNDYNKVILKNLEEIIKKSKENLSYVQNILDIRADYDDTIKIEFFKIHKKFDEISNFNAFEELKTFELYNAEIDKFNQLINNFNIKSDEFIKNQSKNIENFSNYIIGLRNKYHSSVKKLKSNLRILNSQKIQKIKSRIIQNLKVILKTKIEDHQLKFQENLYKFENEAYKLKKKEDIESLNKILEDYYIQINKYLKNSQQEIDDFLKINETNYKLTRLKYKFEDILKSWNPEEIREGLIIFLGLFM